jgi:RNA polymerase sigma factor (sigma-70 family)
MIKSNTLTFEQIEPTFHKWAKHFCNKYFDYWELINSAWCYGNVRFLPQSKIKYASARIKYDMIDYMRLTSKERNRKFREKRGNSYPKFKNFSVLNGVLDTDTLFSETISAKFDDNGTEQRDLFNHLMKGLSKREKLIINLMYIEGLTKRETAKACGLHQTRITQIHGNLMERFRSLDYSKAI